MRKIFMHAHIDIRNSHSLVNACRTACGKMCARECVAKGWLKIQLAWPKSFQSNWILRGPLYRFALTSG